MLGNFEHVYIQDFTKDVELTFSLKVIDIDKNINETINVNLEEMIAIDQNYSLFDKYKIVL